jgi:hypothetical protein
MKAEVRFDMLNFIIDGFAAATMDLDTRALAENLALRSIYLLIFALI